jgi:hypothetical protein
MNQIWEIKLTDDSREAFAERMIELGWTEQDTKRYGGDGGFYSTIMETAYIGWRARDAEIETLKARVEKLEKALIEIGSYAANIQPDVITILQIKETVMR